MTKLMGQGTEKTNGNRGYMRKYASFLAICAIILTLSVAGLAQELTATLTGTVTDSSQAVVAGAVVTVHSERQRY